AYCWGSQLWMAQDVELGERVATRVPVFDGVPALRANGDVEDKVCVLEATGIVRCWGDSRYGALGPLAPGRERAGVSPVQGAVGIAVGAHRVCAIDGRRQVHCWGRGDGGALGEVRARRDYRPTEVPGVRAESLEVGRTRSCARTASGWVCWGRSERESELDFWRARPVEVPAGDRPVDFGPGCALEGRSLRCGDRRVSVREVAPLSRCVVTAERRVACVEEGELVDVEGATGVVTIGGDPFLLLALTEGGELVRFFFESGEYDDRLQVGEDVVQLATVWAGTCLRRRDGS